MAEKNFARSGTADTDFLADDDPLSELARIVGYDPRPVSHPIVEDVPAVAPEPVAVLARPQPAPFALEDELLREFELYDAPRLDPTDHIESYAAPEPVDVSAEIYPREGDIEQVPAVVSPVDDFASEARMEPEFEAAYHPAEAAGGEATEPLLAEPAEELPFAEPEIDVSAFSADAADWPVLGPVEPVQIEPVEDVPADVLQQWTGPHFSEEPTSAAYEPIPSIEPEEQVHGVPEVPADEHHTLADAYLSEEPLSREAVLPEPVSHERDDRTEPVFLGFQPSDFPEIEPVSPDIDLDRELELSLGSAFADEAASDDGRAMHDTALRYEPPAAEPETVEAGLVEPAYDNMVEPAYEERSERIYDDYSRIEPSDPDVDAEAAVHAGLAPVVPADEQAVDDEIAQALLHPADDQAAFEPETTYAAPTVDYDPDATVTHHGSGAHAEEWQSETAAAFHPNPAYAVTDVAPADNAFDLDDLLAEVERFPVPEPHGRALSAETFATRDTSFTAVGDADRPFFTRATPVARLEALARSEPAAVEIPDPTPVEEPVLAAPAEEVAAEADDLAAVDLAFENFEIELGDLDLDLDPADFTVEEPLPQPVAAAGASLAQTPRAADRFVEPVRSPPQCEARDEEPVALPFDPSLIAATEESVAPVADLNVPQLPAVEKEKPQAYASDYDFDIDAEMAQLFADPEASAHPQGAAEADGMAPAAFPVEAKSGPDEFEKALEEDFRRSMSETDRMAIPIDASQTNASYAGEGYDEPSGRGRKILLAACGASFVLLAGIGAYAWMFGGSVDATGEPRIILADNEPIKMVPEERGGKTVPNQDKAVYDRVAGQSDRGPQQEQLVTSVEEPIDVVQRTLTPETLPLEGRNDDPLDGATPVSEAESRLLPGVEQADTEKEAESAPVIAPRKVRTMIVKPDGTLVAREEVEPEPAVETASSETSENGDIEARLAAPTGDAADADISVADTNPAAVDGAASATANADAAGATTPLEEVATANVDETAPVRVVRTTTVGADETADNTPVPESRPAEQPVSVVGTVTDQGNVRGEEAAATPASEAETTATTTETAAETQVAAANPGGYVIQIASLPSEAEAQRSYDNLSARFAGVIGGRGVDIRRADIPNKGTYYRVRIPAGSREEANALCSRYKSAGGSCLVTR